MVLPPIQRQRTRMPPPSNGIPRHQGTRDTALSPTRGIQRGRHRGTRNPARGAPRRTFKGQGERRRAGGAVPGAVVYRRDRFLGQGRTLASAPRRDDRRAARTGTIRFDGVCAFV